MRVGRGVAATVLVLGALLACENSDSGSVSADAGAGAAGRPFMPPGEDGAPCATDAECRGAYCVESECTSGSEGQHCLTNGHCRSRICIEPADGVADSRCGSGRTGSLCVNDAHCFSRLCTAGACSPGAPCTQDSDCKNEQTCFTPEEGAPHCYRGEISEPCRRNQDCVTGFCNLPSGSELGKCVTAPP